MACAIAKLPLFPALHIRAKVTLIAVDPEKNKTENMLKWRFQIQLKESVTKYSIEYLQEIERAHLHQQKKKKSFRKPLMRREKFRVF